VAWRRSTLDVHRAPLSLYEVSPKARSANREVSREHNVAMSQGSLQLGSCLAPSVPARNTMIRKCSQAKSDMSSLTFLSSGNTSHIDHMITLIIGVSII
jgi:hypothetical protein